MIMYMCVRKWYYLHVGWEKKINYVNLVGCGRRGCPGGWSVWSLSWDGGGRRLAEDVRRAEQRLLVVFGKVVDELEKAGWRVLQFLLRLRGEGSWC